MQPLRVDIILEILGKPANHIVDSLGAVIDKIGTEKGIKVLNKKIHEPIELKDAKDIYTTFAEVSLEINSVLDYFNLLFAYMPAHVELISPDEITLTNLNFTEVGNRLLGKMHEYDNVVKNIAFERNIIISELQKSAPEVLRKLAPKHAAPETPEESVKKPAKKAKKSKKK